MNTTKEYFVVRSRGLEPHRFRYKHLNGKHSVLWGFLGILPLISLRVTFADFPRFPV